MDNGLGSVPGDVCAKWLSRLVQIPSVSPDQAGPRAGTPGEARLGAQLARWFEDLGAEVYQDEVLPGRSNVYGIWRGRSDRWAALDVHQDTAGVEEMTLEPFEGKIHGGRVYGRGAVDTKASLAVALAVLESLHGEGKLLEPNLLLVATVDEEVGARGAPAFARWVRQQGILLDQLMVAEPTGCAPVYGHKGVLRLEFEVQGRPAHSSQPELGMNAVVAASRLVLGLDEEHIRLQTETPETPLGVPTLSVTIIQGGEGINVVPSSCRVAIDRRVVADERLDQLTESISDLADRSCPLPLTAKVLQQIDYFLQAPTTPWLQNLVNWSGQEPTIAPFGTNAFAYGGLAKETVVLGPGSIDQAHSKEEWVAVSELEKLAGIYAHWWGISG